MDVNRFYKINLKLPAIFYGFKILFLSKLPPNQFLFNSHKISTIVLYTKYAQDTKRIKQI